MRTVILVSSLLLADALYAIAQSNGHTMEPIGEVAIKIVGVLLLASAVMDIVDLFKSKG